MFVSMFDTAPIDLDSETANVSTHFSWAEVTASTTAERLGIDNSLPVPLIDAVKNTAAHMELVRSLLRSPIIVTSWYRCPTLNATQKSKPTSQHVKGEAVDFKCPGYGTAAAAVKCIEDHFTFVLFDQLILEHSWVHISFNSIPGSKQRGQVLSLLQNGTYTGGITDSKGNPL